VWLEAHLIGLESLWACVFLGIFDGIVGLGGGVSWLSDPCVSKVGHVWYTLWHTE